MREDKMMPGMDEDDFVAFLEQLRRYVAERLVPAEQAVIEADRIPSAILDEMRDLGLFGLTTPEEFGGADMNVSQYVCTIRELAKAAPAYRSIISINTGMFTSALKRGGTPQQKQEWLARSAAGEVACFCLTEPDSGSDAAALVTKANRRGDHYVINGTKRYITNAPSAALGLVMARTSADNLPRNQHVSAFLIDMKSPGVAVSRPDAKMGQKGAQIADVILQDVRVPLSALLGGEEGKGFTAAMQALDTGRLSVGAAALGTAERALQAGLDYARERKAFGTPIAQFQLVQAMLADSRTDIYAAECMMIDACRRADSGMRITLEASAFKMFASEMCGRVVDRVVQIYGGAGYLAEYPAERFFRDARLYRIYEGTTQIQQLVIAKQMLRSAGESG